MVEYLDYMALLKNIQYSLCISMLKYTIKKIQGKRGQTEKNTQFGKLSPIGYFKSPVGDILYNWGLVICYLNLLYLTKILNLQLGMLSLNGNFISPIENNIPNWEYFLLVL